jgi:hypothetical protein
MSGRQLAGSVFACQLILLCCFVAFARDSGELGAANPQVATAPPDLSGVWTRIRVGAGHRDDAPAMTPWAESKYKSARAASADPLAELTDTSFSCIPPGVPRIYDQAPPFEIIQVPGRVIMFFEFDHFVRQIFMDGRAHDKNIVSTWMGDSIGAWDGDTLVVDTTGFNDKTRLDNLGHPHSDALHLVERIHRVDHDTLEVDITIDDPKSYVKSWGRQQFFQLKPDWHIMERVCYDNLSFNDFYKKANRKPGK